MRQAVAMWDQGRAPFARLRSVECSGASCAATYKVNECICWLHGLRRRVDGRVGSQQLAAPKLCAGPQKRQAWAQRPNHAHSRRYRSVLRGEVHASCPMCCTRTSTFAPTWILENSLPIEQIMQACACVEEPAIQVQQLLPGRTRVCQ